MLGCGALRRSAFAATSKRRALMRLQKGSALARLIARDDEISTV